MNKELKNKRRIRCIDTLKGLAIIGVILVHFNTAVPAPNHFLSSITEIGSRCPQMFFLITAFLLWMSSKKYDFSKKDDVKNFITSKLSRILPLYFLAITSFAILNAKIGIGSLISHYLLLNSLSPFWINDIIGVEWYIADLTILYIITPPLLRYVNGLKPALIALSIAFIISSITQILYFAFTEGGSGNYDIKVYFKNFCFFIQFPTIMLGSVIYFLYVKWNEHALSRKRILLIYSICATILIVTFVVSMSKLNALSIVSNSFFFSLVWGELFLCFLLFYKKPRKWLQMTIDILGRYSLGIYLFHIMIIRYFQKFHMDDFCDTNLMWLIFAVIIISASLIVGFCAEKIVGRTYYIIKKKVAQVKVDE